MDEFYLDEIHVVYPDKGVINIEVGLVCRVGGGSHNLRLSENGEIMSYDENMLIGCEIAVLHKIDEESGKLLASLSNVFALIHSTPGYEMPTPTPQKPLVERSPQ